MTIKISRISALAAGVLLAGGMSAQAALFTVTEGQGQNRDFVAGSTDLEDAPNSGGFDLNDLINGGIDFGAGDVVGIYGRIVNATDTFTFNFTATQGFNVVFDFDGYDVDKNKDGTVDGTVAAGYSGLINQSDLSKSLTEIANGAGGDKAVSMTLTKNGGGSTTRDFTTNVTSVTGDSAWIFGGDSGDYTLSIKGTGKTAALYDLQIAAVPLPAGMLLLGLGLAGVGGARVMQKRRKA